MSDRVSIQMQSLLCGDNGEVPTLQEGIEYEEHHFIGCSQPNDFIRAMRSMLSGGEATATSRGFKYPHGLRKITGTTGNR